MILKIIRALFSIAVLALATFVVLNANSYNSLIPPSFNIVEWTTELFQQKRVVDRPQIETQPIETQPIETQITPDSLPERKDTINLE